MSSCTYKIVSTLDGFLCLFIFFPLAILHWRGTWGLQDVYFFPKNEAISGWFSFTLGSIGCVILQFCQPLIFSWVTPKHKFQYYIVSRIFLYVSGWFVMCYWRGVWDTLDYYLTEHWLNSVIIYAFTQVLTLVTKTSRNNLGLPFSLAVDTDEELLTTGTVLRVQPTESLKYLCDICYTQFIIVTSNICVWRGIWNVYDSFFFPEDRLLSDVGSLALGYLLCIQLFMLQWPAGITSARLDSYPLWTKVLFEDVIIFASGWANLLLWRGAWDLCIAYVIPEPTLGGWVSHWVGTLGLILLQTFNTVSLNGMEIDGEYKNGEGVFPTDYLRFFFKDALKKKNPEQEYLMESADGSISQSLSDSCFSDEETNVYTLGNNNSNRQSNGYKTVGAATEQETQA